ncbi:MAG: pantoate--beta-alanine ligase, partial [Bacteroidota bacterium]
MLKLFNIVRPHMAFFGEKDRQQLTVVRKMADDLNLDVTVVGLPTVREPDGLAMSSRNVYLSAEERRRALTISQTLFWIRDQIKAGKKNLIRLRKEGLHRLQAKVERVDYFEVVDPQTL